MVTDQLEEGAVLALRRIARAVDRYSRRLLTRSGLTLPQLSALREIERKGQVSPSQLARALHLSQPTLTGIIDRLVRNGMAVRARGDLDRRTVSVAITEAGREALETAPSLLQDRFLRGLRALEDRKQQELVTALQRIADMMESPEPDPAPAEAAEGLLAVASPDPISQGSPPEGLAAVPTWSHVQNIELDAGGSIS